MILSANTVRLPTGMIGSTDSVMYRSVISSPDAAQSLTHHGGLTLACLSPQSGTANKARYVSA